MNMLHNSTLAAFRSPLGAVKTNGSVLLRLYGVGISEVKVRVFHNDVGRDYDMIFENGFWNCQLSLPSEPCVLWYYFLAETDAGICYYGPPFGKSQGEGVVWKQPCPSFQLTVFAEEFDTPEWFRKSTMYQIFPDRFCRGNPENLRRGEAYHRKMGRRVIKHKSWQEPPLYQPLKGEIHYSPCDFFGGDFRGIINSLEELHSLGVNLLYLNPIVEAASNHRYDTADYLRVDPILGTNEEFRELCEKARRLGIRILLDGVYSHTGSDSRYFNREKNYPEPGAYQGKKSPYYSWYTFFDGPDRYKCWWNFETLPEVNEEDPRWQEYVITGENSVFHHWLSLGASGFRLDVADELPDDVIEKMRQAVKANRKDNVLLGEVWEDATTKRSYGTNRRYALGRGLDSVMNYPFKDAVLSFLQNQTGAPELENFLTSQRLNYPKPMYYALMNLLSSHDVPRVRTILATGKNGDGMSREEQAALSITRGQDLQAAQLQKLAVVLQFAIPGVPAIYYGDEYGMHGFKDPFNRAPFNRRDPGMRAFYRRISGLRKSLPSLQTGEASFLALGEDGLAILRFCVNGRDAFGSPAENEAVLILLNRGESPLTVQLELSCFSSGLSEEVLRSFQGCAFTRAVCLEGSKSSEKQIPITSGQLSLTVGEVGFVMLTLE